MNTNDIKDLVNMVEVSGATSKSLVNRLESALGKEGSAHARLSMAGSSLLNLSDKVGEDDSGMVAFMGTMLKYCAELAKEIHAPAPKAKKETRETWYEADSPEAQEILSKSRKTSRKAKQETSPAIAPEILEALAQILATRK